MGNPAPYLPGTDALIAATHRQEAWLEFVDVAGTSYPLPFLDAEVSFDEARAPRVQINATVPDPGDELLARLDPRLGGRLRAFAGYVWPNGTRDVRMLADLGIGDRVVDREAGTVTLDAGSDEAMVIDAGHMNAGTIATSSTRAGIQSLVDGAFGSPRTWQITGSDTTAVNMAVTDTDRWDNVDELADRLDLDVFDDGTRTWFIKPRSSTTGTPVHELRVGDAGTVLEANTNVSRRGGEYANRVHVVYKWVDSAGASKQVIGVGYVSTGPLAFAGDNRVIARVERSVATSQTVADTVARNIVRRTVTRGRSHDLRAVSAYWLRPTHTVTVQLPAGGPEDQLVAAVAYDLAEKTMRVRTRVTDTAVTIA